MGETREPRKVRIFRRLKLLAGVFTGLVALAAFSAEDPPSATLSRIIEAAGRVEFQLPGSTNWQPAAVGRELHPGDRVRTHARSRAAVQLSDRSVIRMNERTTLEILPPRSREKRRFRLPRGSLYFFNREKPASVEFDTPLAAGAIRGTEFLLEVAEADSALHLALIDGLVTLQTSEGEVAMKRGEDLRLARGQPPQRTALLNANAAIQWALYYPAVLVPADVELLPSALDGLEAVLAHYRAGDLLAALAAWPDGGRAMSEGSRSLRAQLELAVGRVTEAEQLLADAPADAPTVAALRELIGTVRGDAEPALAQPRTASEWLARSYTLQAVADLEGARAAAREAVKLAPHSGFTHARLAELEFAFGRRRAALAQLREAQAFSPRLAPAQALHGFILLEQGKPSAALGQFDQARELDAAFGPAWLGRGLCLMRERRFAEARKAFQAAAALEPQRALFRGYLGKAASELGEANSAEKEFRLAKELDPNDPTAWLYSALHLWQHNRLNEAIRDLERSADLNNQLAPFRSRLLLDGDRSVRSANLSALYDDVGLNEVGRRAAERSVAESYANFSGHLFLANSYQALEDVNRFDLRFETARQSELLVANLLAPPGGGNLSQVLSQQDHLRFFDPRPISVSSLTEYGSGGDWSQVGSLFGTLKGFSYAFDTVYQSLNGDQPNGDAERLQFILTGKQRVSADDEFYFQAGRLDANAGDVARHYDPADANTTLRVQEYQEPTLYAGWHHAWSPGVHTLALFSRLDDRLRLQNGQADVIFLRQTGGVTTEVQAPPAGPPFALDFESDFTLHSAELQQIWETPRHSLVVGGRWQGGDADNRATLSRTLTGTVTDQDKSGTLQRGDLYAYATWRIIPAMSLVGGLSYSHMDFPENGDLAPISMDGETRDLVAPKLGLLVTPWEHGLLRASYTESLGGLYFDNSVRLEPTQVGGFNQAFRSLIPESVVGLVPGTEFRVAGVGFDQSFRGGTFFGVQADWLSSDGDRTVGVLTNSTFLPIPDSPGRTRQTLDFEERSISAYVSQLLGNDFSLGARYRVSQSDLTGRFPEIPDSATGLTGLEQDTQATLHQLSLTANVHLRNGLFGQWESAWFSQSNAGYTPSLDGDNFWQHNVYVGYRLARRRLELRVGVLNLFDQDYRLNPLNPYPLLPRERTFVASLRLNF